MKKTFLLIFFLITGVIVTFAQKKVIILEGFAYYQPLNPGTINIEDRKHGSGDDAIRYIYIEAYKRCKPVVDSLIYGERIYDCVLIGETDKLPGKMTSAGEQNKTGFWQLQAIERSNGMQIVDENTLCCIIINGKMCKKRFLCMIQKEYELDRIIAE